VDNLRIAGQQDRVIVPTLEVIAYLFHVGVFGGDDESGSVVDYKGLCLLVQRAGYKSGNVRKIEACVRVYGAVAALSQEEDKQTAEGVKEAKKRLGALLLHPWPRVRSMVVDELWGLLVVADQEKKAEKLLGADWGKAEKEAIKRLVGELGLT
jgi:hypothetical protein